MSKKFMNQNLSFPQDLSALLKEKHLFFIEHSASKI